MGGGPAMRTATKAVGVGLVHGGRRAAGFWAIPGPSEQMAMRSTSGPTSGVIASASQPKLDEVSVVQRPSSEFDDWEFACREEDLLIPRYDGGEPMARLVFGGAPTIQEAKEATSELKEAIDKELLPSSNPAVPLLSNANYSENEPCMWNKTGPAPVPKGVMKAFAMLSESPAAQSVVASVASDPNVWNAVIQNEALMEYLKSNKTSKMPFTEYNGMVSVNTFLREEINNRSPGAVIQYAKSVDCDKESCAENVTEGSARLGASFMGFVQGVKHKVLDLISNASTYFQDLFWFPAAEAKSAEAQSKAKPFLNESRTIFGLAVLVILVVLLKRV